MGQAYYTKQAVLSICVHCLVYTAACCPVQGIKPDRQREVLQYYQYSADRGNVEAQTAVGTLLNVGTHGVVRDHEAAAHYLQRAAASGSAEAMAHLGHMYGAGMGVALVSHITSARLFRGQLRDWCGCLQCRGLQASAAAQTAILLGPSYDFASTARVIDFPATRMQAQQLSSAHYCCYTGPY